MFEKIVAFYHRLLESLLCRFYELNTIIKNEEDDDFYDEEEEDEEREWCD